MLKQTNVYVLSVGINLYASEGIENLKGCEKDVHNLKKVLSEKYNIPEKYYKTLLNHEATRQGIIHSFRTHFKNLDDGDIAVFHFSGHGSWESTHHEFVFEGGEQEGGRNETIVCHDSKKRGIYNIADKELRGLISEIQYPLGRTPKQVLFVGLLDCCHSGSMFRHEEENWKVRMTSPSPKLRPLNSYVKETFKISKTNKKVLFPPVNYISLAACSHKELAMEEERGSLFTNALISLLSEEREYSYAVLHQVTHFLVNQKSYFQQNPSIEYYGDVNPQFLFLRNSSDSSFSLPKLVPAHDKWKVRLGAIHGLDKSKWENRTINIFSQRDLTIPVGVALVEVIGVEQTVCTVKIKENELYEKEHYFYIPLFAKMLSIRLIVETLNKEMISVLNEMINEPMNRNIWYWNDLAKYELLVEDSRYSIFSTNGRGNKQLIFEIATVKKNSTKELFNTLCSIAKWENIRMLTTPKISKILPEQIRFKIDLWTQHKSLEANLLVPEVLDMADRKTLKLSYFSNQPIFYRVTVSNQFPNFGGLYFYLIHLDRYFKITQKHESYLKRQLHGETQILYDSYKAHKALAIVDPYISETTDTFILIGSETPLCSPYIFEQEGLDVNTDAEKRKHPKTEVRRNANSGSALWIVKRIDVKLDRNFIRNDFSPSTEKY